MFVKIKAGDLADHMRVASGNTRHMQDACIHKSGI